MKTDRFGLLLGLFFLFTNLLAHANDVTLHVYKSPSCGCCSKWIDHLNDSNIAATFTETNQLATIKAKYGISRPYQSCHTAISKQGYIFEGHVPAKLVKQFLDKPPENTSGLTVPAMPVGTPGMESGDRFQPYQVLLLQKDGGVRVYADIKSKEEQY